MVDDRPAWRAVVLLRALPARRAIYDLAAPLHRYTAPGDDFVRLRAELRRLFGLEGT